MSHELTNLLPKEKTRAFRRGYFIRLGAIGVVVAALIVVAHGLLLVPSYLFLSQQVTEREGQLATLSASLGASDEQQVSARIDSLSHDTQYLERLATVPSASGIFRALLAVPRHGITLTGITFSPAKKGSDGHMQLTGMAATRESLQSFQSALTNLPFVSSADLPISSFAKDSDIPFSISLSGTLQP